MPKVIEAEHPDRVRNWLLNSIFNTALAKLLLLGDGSHPHVCYDPANPVGVKLGRGMPKGLQNASFDQEAHVIAKKRHSDEEAFEADLSRSLAR